MKSMFHFALVFAAGAALTAGARADESDPATGTWKLNVAKSKFSPGPGPKSITLKIEASADEQKVTAEGVYADGKSNTIEYTAKFDGKDHPIKGSPVADTVSLKRIDDRTIERTDKKDGKVVQTRTRVMSEDGKTFTVTMKGTNAKGQQVHSVAVFEKQ